MERDRRQILILRRQALADLGQIEPEGREIEWRRALQAHTAAIQRAGEGPRVDVHDEDLAESRTRITEEFDLEECF